MHLTEEEKEILREIASELRNIREVLAHYALLEILLHEEALNKDNADKGYQFMIDYHA